MVFRAVVFTFVPTAVELVLVCFLLGRIFKPIIAVMVVGTFVAYVFWTAQLTKAAAKVYARPKLASEMPSSACISRVKSDMFIPRMEI